MNRGLTIHLVQAGVHSTMVSGNPAAARADLSLPCLRGKPAHVCSRQVESRLPIALLLVPAVLQPAKEALLFLLV